MTFLAIFRFGTLHQSEIFTFLHFTLTNTTSTVHFYLPTQHTIVISLYKERGTSHIN